MPSHVTHAKNIGSWHPYPLFMDEEIEARRSQVTFISGALSSSPQSHQVGPLVELVHSPQSPLSFPISRGKEISAACLIFFFPEVY